MDLKKIAITAGSGLLNTLLPGSGTIAAGLLNQFLGPESQVDPDTLTGAEYQQKLQTLSPEQQVTIQLKALEVEQSASKDFVEIQRALNEADANGNSTRPKIALLMSYVVIGVIVIYGIALITAIIMEQTDVLPDWEVLTALMGIPSMVLANYFGHRAKEKIARTQMAASQSTNTDAASVAAIGSSVVGSLVTKLIK